MKINTPAKRTRKKLIIPLIVVLLIGAGTYTIVAATNNLWPFTASEESREETDLRQTSSEPVTTENSEDSAQNTLEDPENNPESHIPPKYDTPDDTVESDGLTGVISHTSVRDGNLVIRTTINQFLSNGDCILTLTRSSDNKTVTKKAPIVANPSTSSCDGFDIPTSELGSGSWNVVINLKSGDQQGRLTNKISI